MIAYSIHVGPLLCHTFLGSLRNIMLLEAVLYRHYDHINNLVLLHGMPEQVEQEFLIEREQEANVNVSKLE